MATRTMGTSSTTALTAVLYGRMMADADVATIAALIKNDTVGLNPIVPGAFAKTGLLYVPNRGVLQVLPGDFVAVDPATGWPILVSLKAAASNPQWVHS
jgi:hypothetical protein